MLDLLVLLLPLIIASAFIPVLIMMSILLLRSNGGVSSALAFAAGMTSVRLVGVFGLALLLGAENSDVAAADDGGQSLVLSGILLGLGVLLLGTGARLLLTGEDPDAPPPKWTSIIQSIAPLKAYVLGAAVLVIQAKQWVFMLSAVKVIKDADISSFEAVLAYLAYALLAESLIVTPTVAYVLGGERIDSLLGSTETWLRQNNHQIAIGVALLFGAIFALKGLTGLGVL